MARILVLDGHCNAALAFTRSLGHAGHWVAVGSSQGLLAPAAQSRYCRRSFEYPASTEEPEHFFKAVLNFVRENEIELVAPLTDWTTFPLVKRRSQLREVASLAAPSLEALEIVSDKYRTIILARGLKVPVPETLLVRSFDDLEVARQWPQPIVVKDRFSVRWLEDKVVLGSTSYAYSWDDLCQKVRQRLEEAGDVLIQKLVGGRGVGFSCFALEGKAYAPFQWQRVREENPCGGASSARKSVALDPQVLEFGRNLMMRSGFQGIGMVEFKWDPATRGLCLMEINGRPWGSIQLAVESGIDYPQHVAYWFLQGVRPPERVEYKKHITCRKFVGDLDHLAHIRKGKPVGWPGTYPGFWSTLFKVSIPWYPGLRYEDLYLRDLKPGLVELYEWLRLRFEKLFKRCPWQRRRHNPSINEGLIIRGIVHCHTTLSYDGKVELTDLCKLLRQQGFGFVALTEHPQGVSAANYRQFVRKCQEASNGEFVVIPGLEFRCDGGVEIAGIGVSELLHGGAPDRVVACIREDGGFAIWVHPWRNRRWTCSFLDCDAVEVLNLKVDGTLAPNLTLWHKTVQERKAGRQFHAIFGVDFHDLSQPFSAWVECQVPELTPRAIVESLCKGRFVNRVPYATMPSSGTAALIDCALMVLFRLAFLVWAALLRRVPESMRDSLLALSRPAVRLVRGSAPRRHKT